MSLTLDGYRVRARASLPSRPTHPRELLPIFWDFSQAVTSAATERERDAGRRVSCRKGCSACCRLHVQITPAEAFHLRQLIDDLPEPRRRRVEARFDALRETLVGAGLWERVVRADSLSEDEQTQLARDYWSAQLACPFLEDGACSIYSQRPLVCREYLVTSPAEECSQVTQGRVRRVRLPWAAWARAHEMSQRDHGGDELVALPALREWTARHAEPRAQYTGVELFLKAFAGVSVAEDAPPLDVEGGSPDDAAAPATAVQGCIVPDYALPDALMVPSYGLEESTLLEEIASAASASVGVILLTPDPARGSAFIAGQPDPERFALVVAASNTAWIHDRAPFAVRDESGETRWILPRLPADDRADDARLFESICARPVEHANVIVARGNLVAGPRGVAFSTNAVLRDNRVANAQGLADGARQLGVRRWILLPPFQNEMTQHADVYLRFLREDCVAIGWNLSSADDRALAEQLEALVTDALPGMRSLRIPMRSEGSRYASPLNWIQLGRDLLVPRYTLTRDADAARIRQLLETEGFRVRFLDSPTLSYGGALHCLTAPIHL